MMSESVLFASYSLLCKEKTIMKEEKRCEEWAEGGDKQSYYEYSIIPVKWSSSGLFDQR